MNGIEFSFAFFIAFINLRNKSPFFFESHLGFVNLSRLLVMTRKLLFLFICISISFVSAGQENLGLKPVVIDRFDKLFLNENFDSAGTYWTTVSNSENLILVQDGEYILNRKAPTSPFAAMGSFKNSLTSYRLVTSLKLEKSASDEAAIGLIFMAQPGGQGGFIFEINKIKQYRLRQITGGIYRYLTGNAATGGWLKSNVFKNVGLPNLVEIRTADKNYDIYLNNVLILSFSEIAYKFGEIGFLVGPLSKGRVDFLYMFSTQKDNENNQNSSKQSNSENDVLALAESIITLKNQINKLAEENEDLKQVINSMKNAEKESEYDKEKTELNIKNLEQQAKQNKEAYDSLLKVNTDLLKYKEMVSGNDNGDLVINLSKNLKAEKLKNEALTKQIQLLTEGKEIPKSTPTSNSPTKDKPEETQKSDGGFVLPKEN